MNATELPTIDLQAKAQPLNASIRYFWYDNPNIGLALTRFHQIEILLTSFSTGLPYVEEPFETSIQIGWIELDITNPADLHELTISHESHPTMEASVYLGGAHNMIKVKSLKLSRLMSSHFQVEADLDIDFQSEGVAVNEPYFMSVVATYIGEM